MYQVVMKTLPLYGTCTNPSPTVMYSLPVFYCEYEHTHNQFEHCQNLINPTSSYKFISTDTFQTK